MKVLFEIINFKSSEFGNYDVQISKNWETFSTYLGILRNFWVRFSSFFHQSGKFLLNSMTSELVSNFDSLQFWPFIGDTFVSNLTLFRHKLMCKFGQGFVRHLTPKRQWFRVKLGLVWASAILGDWWHFRCPMDSDFSWKLALIEHEFLRNFGKIDIFGQWAKDALGFELIFEALFHRESSVLHDHVFFSYLKNVRKYSKNKFSSNSL